jgi:hypothetical protein
MKSYEERREYITRYLLENHAVDIMCGPFIDKYSKDMEVKVVIQMWGPNGCPTLARDLKKMYEEGRLKRARIGLGYNWAVGFPRWVWQYRL